LKPKGFSAVYRPDNADYSLPNGRVDTWWQSGAIQDQDNYGSFNDGNFDDQEGSYTVPATGQYSIAVNFILAIPNDSILNLLPSDNERFITVTAITTNSDGIMKEHTIAGSVVSETIQQTVTTSVGTVTGNTVDKLTTVTVNRTVRLNAGDIVLLAAFMSRPWHLVGYLEVAPNTFSIIKVG